MKEFISIALAVIIGGLIGYITNVLAIKLLFRPLKPFRIPIINFEIWGLIPKRKEEIAKNIGEVISNELLSVDDIISNSFTSEDKDQINDLILVKIKNIIGEKINVIPMPFRIMAEPLIDEIINKEVPKAIADMSDDIIDNLKNKINIDSIVEEKVKELDLLELENIILKICKKELTQIENWGLILGAIIGLVQGLLGLLI